MSIIRINNFLEVDQVQAWGGSKEATILIHGGMVTAYNAALVNSAMTRALDFCDAMKPGMHAGSSSVPTALATVDRCSPSNPVTVKSKSSG